MTTTYISGKYGAPRMRSSALGDKLYVTKCTWHWGQRCPWRSLGGWGDGSWAPFKMWLWMCLVLYFTPKKRNKIKTIKKHIPLQNSGNLWPQYYKNHKPWKILYKVLPSISNIPLLIPLIPLIVILHIIIVLPTKAENWVIFLCPTPRSESGLSNLLLYCFYLRREKECWRLVYFFYFGLCFQCPQFYVFL